MTWDTPLRRIDDVDGAAVDSESTTVDQGSEVLAQAGLFQGVTSEAREALSSGLQFGDYTRGEAVFHEGEQGDTLYIVLSGKV